VWLVFARYLDRGFENMERALFLSASILAISAFAYAGPAPTVKRDKAVKEVEACLSRGRVPSRECKNIDKNARILVEAYWHGDKTVLPLLLRVRIFTHLTDFYSAALLTDSETFLADLSLLPEKQQRTIALDISGRVFGLTSDRFEAIRSTLQSVPQASPNYQLAHMCLLTLESENASLLVNYFPPQIFAGRAAYLEVHAFSSGLYALQAKPMWPPASSSATIYRVTIFPAFLVPESVALTVLPDGSGQVSFHALASKTSLQLNSDARTITAQQVADFAAALDSAQFWQEPTERQYRDMGMDGAEYLFEGVQTGAYHVVLRWCPGARKETSFTDIAQKLFDLSDHPLKGGC
jgi:hypothetical protein